jgi:ABC-type Mn2+/Zn2+ transport system ATPase subunit
MSMVKPTPSCPSATTCVPALQVEPEILHDLSIYVNPNEIVIGPNGASKSTAMKAVLSVEHHRRISRLVKTSPTPRKRSSNAAFRMFRKPTMCS